MEETIICPICETENAADATHCEVCGERLAPAAADEEIPAEENVAAMLQEESAADVTDESPVAEATDEMLTPDSVADDAALLEEIDSFVDDEEGELEPDDQFQDDEEPEGLMEGSATGAMQDDASLASEGSFVDEMDDSPAADFDLDEEIEEEPRFLYSPLDGAAYPRGSMEYEEGFGPNGEELVATPPEGVAEPSVADEASEADIPAERSAVPVPADGPDEEFAAQITGARAHHGEPSPEFRHAFQARPKERPSMQPLPQPGVYAEPATLTVYLNRQPVLRHAIETDEVLIGRRDPVADAYPDLDLTEFDPDAHVSRKHAYVYRQNKNYTLYAISNAGTQLNSELLELGDRRPLSNGDVVVLAGKIAMKFELPGA